MPYATCRSTARIAGTATDVLEENGLAWLKFGNDYFCYGTDPGNAVGLGKLASLGFTLDARPPSPAEDGRVNEQWLFVVTQEGRLFQRTHPEVSVLHDGGRYLVVSLDPKRAANVAQHPARFALRPAKRNQVVFDVAPRPLIAPTVDRHIQGIVDAVSRNNFASTLTELASYPTRHSLSSHYQDAARRIRDRLEMMGYDASLQEVSLSGGKSLNIVADKRGSANDPRSVTLVTAHLDSINHPPGNAPDDPTAPAPGADDNASGSSGVIEIARLFKDEPIRQDLRLILFGGEEQRLHGSKQYVQQLVASERARIGAVVNMDMIASLNNVAPSVLLEGGDPVSKDTIAALAAAAHTYTGLGVNIALNPYDSDHVPFIEAGMPAVLTIEGNDGKNPYIHTADDTLEHINYDLAMEILRMNVAFVASRVRSSEARVAGS